MLVTKKSVKQIAFLRRFLLQDRVLVGYSI